MNLPVVAGRAQGYAFASVRGGQDDGLALGDPAPGATSLEGPLPAVVRWAAGRGAEPGQPLAATHDGAPLTRVPAPPRWI